MEQENLLSHEISQNEKDNQGQENFLQRELTETSLVPAIPPPPIKKQGIRQQEEQERSQAYEKLNEALPEREHNINSSNYYEILGVAANASAQEISAAYRDLVKMYHPDLNPNNADAVKNFKKVQVAFETLNDPEKRKLYDEVNAINIKESEATSEEQHSKQELLEGMGITEGALSTVVDNNFGGDRYALTNFVYNILVPDGPLSELTGDMDDDENKIGNFFSGSGLSFNDAAFRAMGEGFYRGAVEARDKNKYSILRLFVDMFKSLAHDFGAKI